MNELAVVGLDVVVAHSLSVALFVPSTLLTWIHEGWIFLPSSNVGTDSQLMVCQLRVGMDYFVLNPCTCSYLPRQVNVAVVENCANVFDVIIIVYTRTTRTKPYISTVCNCRLETILPQSGSQWWRKMPKVKLGEKESPKWNANVNPICFWDVLLTFFSFFLFVFVYWLVGVTSLVCGHWWFAWYCWLVGGCTWMSSWAEMGMNSNVYGMVRMKCDVDDVGMYERSYVFRFCATKSLNSKKPWKKGKISVFSFGMELLWVWVKQGRWWGGTVVNVRKSTSENIVDWLDGWVCSGWRQIQRRNTQ